MAGHGPEAEERGFQSQGTTRGIPSTGVSSEFNGYIYICTHRYSLSLYMLKSTIYICTHTHTLSLHIHLYAKHYTYIHVFMYICVIYICIHIYVHTYIKLMVLDAPGSRF